jgi:hypothetical protein
MGVVKLVLGSSATARYLRAQAVTNPTVSGDPGCPPAAGVVPEHTFGTGAAYQVPADGNMTVLLPYGSWKLLYGTGATATTWNTAVTAVQMVLPTTPTPTRTSFGSVGGSAVVTFDPRVVAP